MCTANFYCSEITLAAVDIIAQRLNLIPELIEESAHIFKAYEMPFDVVAEQRSFPNHPQNIYRELLSDGSLHIYAGHACVEAEVD